MSDDWSVVPTRCRLKIPIYEYVLWWSRDPKLDDEGGQRTGARARGIGRGYSMLGGAKGVHRLSCEQRTVSVFAAVEVDVIGGEDNDKLVTADPSKKGKTRIKTRKRGKERGKGKGFI
jgi:hypothetical protein